LILYRAPDSIREAVEKATPEQVQAVGAAWQAWGTKVGYALTDFGAPVAHTTHVGPGGSAADGVCGYSILEAGSADEVSTLLDNHPHLQLTPGGSIEVLEVIPLGAL
jgi:hypothetical protein